MLFLLQVSQQTELLYGIRCKAAIQYARKVLSGGMLVPSVKMHLGTLGKGLVVHDRLKCPRTCLGGDGWGVFALLLPVMGIL